MKLSYEEFRKNGYGGQFRFVPVTWSGDPEKRVWAIVTDEDLVSKMKIVLTPKASFFREGQPVRIDFDPKERPLLVVHTVQ